ncbi:MAG: polyprenyl synthetase family protein, partial [Bombilactobacillus mellis]|nr:polyprenyl synthetase family protein [Bombilactobacillus mellis]
NFARNFGIAFQIYDDLLDVTSTQEQMGKKVGKDQAAGKNTYVQVLGVHQAQAKLKFLVQEAQSYLDSIDLKNSVLADSLKYFD